MSTAPVRAQSPEPIPAPAIETPALTDAYRKAHKSYVLVAGLLGSWELIGITLNTKEKWGVELKSPAAVPLILFTLVFYSGYKMTIEWLQCDSERRDHFAAKVDYWVAHSIAASAIVISAVQYLWRVRVMEAIHPSRGSVLVLLAGPPFAYICICILISQWRELKWMECLTPVIGVGGIVLLTILIAFKSSRLTNGFGFAGATIFVIVIEILFAKMGTSVWQRRQGLKPD